jgi:hypothetical protein
VASLIFFEKGFKNMRAVCFTAMYLGLAYLICATIVGADNLFPHKYIIITSDGKKYATNKDPRKS